MRNDKKTKKVDPLKKTKRLNTIGKVVYLSVMISFNVIFWIRAMTYTLDFFLPI